MRIPKSLKVGGKKIKIKKLKKLKRAVGEWYPNEYKILLHDSKKAPPERMEECFMHEIMEVVNTFYELELPHWKLNILGEALHQILKDNKIKFYRKS